ncbi:glycosyltransferase [Bacillus wiedmannii]|uniref:glycosyltransferase n=1 Tax=Bacillus wiedmannii TaxID=1890302 RepID=UPI003D968DD0
MDFTNVMFAIFSYNRGNYLFNCIQSIERNYPNLHKQNLVIYDDNSECENTVRILNNLQNKYEVKINKHMINDNSRCGLYYNMNLALQDAIDQNYEYIFFIQEDLQIVRPIDEYFLNECNVIFGSDPNIIQVSPVFFKGTFSKEEFNRFTSINEQFGYYIGNPLGLNGVSDIGITKVKPLKEVNWFFDNDETINMRKGTELGLVYVKPKNPIMMYTPWPETYRYKTASKSKTYTRILDYIYRAGLHTYKDMPEEKINELCCRSIHEYPYAENYLSITENIRLKKPWNYISTRYYVKKKINRFKKVILFK